MKALCEGDCQLSHLSDCDDTKVMLQAFDTVRLAPTCTSANESPQFLTIDIGAAGTSMRFLTAFFAANEGICVQMTGSARMKDRPIALLVDALRELGADIDYAEKEGFPPLNIRGRKLSGGKLSIDGSTSSQYISALLMIAPTLANGLELTLTNQVTSRPYIEMTLEMMREFGVESEWTSDSTVSVKPQRYTSMTYAVESDWSASSYWYQICALAKSAGIKTEFLLMGLKQHSLQGDSHAADYFNELGVVTEFTAEGAVIKPADDFTMPVKVEWNMCNQPDLAQTMISTCCGLGVHFAINGLHTLRIKETDRIAALQNELAKFGFDVKAVGDDLMTWDGDELTTDDLPPFVDTYHDHRMAMAFAPLAITSGDTYICDPEVVSKSYPSFWNDLQSAGIDVEPQTLSRTELAEKFENAMRRQQRIHTHSKWVLNTLLIAVAVLILWLIFKIL